MRPTADLLHGVRRLLAPGWNQVGCVTEDGTQCCHDDEGAWLYDLCGAIYAIAHDAGEALAIWASLDGVTDGFAMTWSMTEGRTHEDVLIAIACAEERATLEAA